MTLTFNFLTLKTVPRIARNIHVKFKRRIDFNLELVVGTKQTDKRCNANRRWVGSN